MLERIGRNVALFRAEKRLRQDQLAEESGVDRSHLGKIERVELNNLSLQTLSKLANALGIRIVDLLLPTKISRDD